METKISTKRVFISYSWEEDEHQQWVKDFATDLRKHGIESRLDRWHLEGGDRLPLFMERELRENDYVLIICTPKYKMKSDKREGGVGYEGDIITSELFNLGNHKKYIPILRKGRWIDAAPTSLMSKYYFDLSDERGSKQYDNMFMDLCACILNIKEEIPKVENPPIERLMKHKGINIETEESFTPIKINKIIIDEVTSPRMDGTRGSALYKIPFELTSTPNRMWKDVFLETWRRPPQWTSMHRPGIASVIGNKIILDGTTMEEVKKYHRDTLILCINKTNEIISEYEQEQRQAKLREKIRLNEHEFDVKNIASEIKFD
ncbi:toll/interleukin-1 receptor domain-containing protein [Clostridium perfringens]|uniref:toll/interleukin-1 receptor domain-containing protein n=1 Tax=Clostridium perfringens TaxID=1502 RepID=UPI0024BD2AAA|nr:toll/interleukin-1 receptor domain-containing protein [Clostridium perfringens]